MRKKKIPLSKEGETLLNFIIKSVEQLKLNLIAFRELYKQFEYCTHGIESLNNSSMTVMLKKARITMWYNYFIGMRDEYCFLHFGGGFDRDIVEGQHGVSKIRDLSDFQHNRDNFKIKDHTECPLEKEIFLVSCSERGVLHLMNEFEVTNTLICLFQF